MLFVVLILLRVFLRALRVSVVNFFQARQPLFTPHPPRYILHPTTTIAPTFLPTTRKTRSRPLNVKQQAAAGDCL